MSAESLGHIFIFIGIISTWLFPLWLYSHWLYPHWLRDDDKMLTDFVVAIAYSGVYFTLISRYFKFTVGVTV